MNVMEKVGLLDESLNRSLFIGPAASGFGLAGNRYSYVTFINGFQTPEGSIGNYVGPGISSDDLMKLAAQEIIKEADLKDATAIVFRAGCTGDEVGEYAAWLDEQGVYHPAGVSLRVRVAFVK